MSHLNLSKSGLTTLQDDIVLGRILDKGADFTTITHLDLSENSLGTIAGISEFSNLTHLKLSNNNLSSLSADFLPPSLQWLDVSCNRLTKLDFAAVIANTEGEADENKDVVTSSSFYWRSVMLSHDLSYGVTLPPRPLQNLAYIDASYNQLSTIENFADVREESEEEEASGGTGGVGQQEWKEDVLGSFLNLLLEKVQILKLAGNSLTTLRGLENFKALQYVDVRHNLLADVEALNYFPQASEVHNGLKEVCIKGNALVYDKSMPRFVAQLLQNMGRNILFDVDIKEEAISKLLNHSVATTAAGSTSSPTSISETSPATSLVSHEISQTRQAHGMLSVDTPKTDTYHQEFEERSNIGSHVTSSLSTCSDVSRISSRKGVKNVGGPISNSSSSLQGDDVHKYNFSGSSRVLTAFSEEETISHFSEALATESILATEPVGIKVHSLCPPTAEETQHPLDTREVRKFAICPQRCTSPDGFSVSCHIRKNESNEDQKRQDQELYEASCDEAESLTASLRYSDLSADSQQSSSPSSVFADDSLQSFHSTNGSNSSPAVESISLAESHHAFRSPNSSWNSVPPSNQNVASVSKIEDAIIAPLCSAASDDPKILKKAFVASPIRFDNEKSYDVFKVVEEPSRPSDADLSVPNEISESIDLEPQTTLLRSLAYSPTLAENSCCPSKTEKYNNIEQIKRSHVHMSKTAAEAPGEIIRVAYATPFSINSSSMPHNNDKLQLRCYSSNKLSPSYSQRTTNFGESKTSPKSSETPRSSVSNISSRSSSPSAQRYAAAHSFSSHAFFHENPTLRPAVSSTRASVSRREQMLYYDHITANSRRHNSMDVNECPSVSNRHPHFIVRSPRRNSVPSTMDIREHPSVSNTYNPCCSYDEAQCVLPLHREQTPRRGTSIGAYPAASDESPECDEDRQRRNSECRIDTDKSTSDPVVELLTQKLKETSEKMDQERQAAVKHKEECEQLKKKMLDLSRGLMDSQSTIEGLHSALQEKSGIVEQFSRLGQQICRNTKEKSDCNQDDETKQGTDSGEASFEAMAVENDLQRICDGLRKIFGRRCLMAKRLYEVAMKHQKQRLESDKQLMLKEEECSILRHDYEELLSQQRTDNELRKKMEEAKSNEEQEVVVQLRENLCNTETQLTGVQGQLEYAQQEVQGLRQQLHENSEKLWKLQHESETQQGHLTEKIRSFQKLLQKRDTEVEELRRETHVLGEIQRLECLIDDYQANEVILQGELSNTQKRLSQALSRVEDLEASVDRWKQEATQWVALAEKHRETLKTLHKLQGDHEQLHKKFKDGHYQNEKLTEECSKLFSEHTNALSANQRALELHQKQSEFLKESLEKSAKEKRTLQKQCATNDIVVNQLKYVLQEHLNFYSEVLQKKSMATPAELQEVVLRLSESITNCVSHLRPKRSADRHIISSVSSRNTPTHSQKRTPSRCSTPCENLSDVSHH